MTEGELVKSGVELGAKIEKLQSNINEVVKAEGWNEDNYFKCNQTLVLVKALASDADLFDVFTEVVLKLRELQGVQKEKKLAMRYQLLRFTVKLLEKIYWKRRKARPEWFYSSLLLTEDAINQAYSALSWNDFKGCLKEIRRAKLWLKEDKRDQKEAKRVQQVKC